MISRNDLFMCIGFWLCEGVRSLGTRVTASCELLCTCWELNLGPLEEQPVFLTTKLSLQPPQNYFQVTGESADLSYGRNERHESSSYK